MSGVKVSSFALFAFCTLLPVAFTSRLAQAQVPLTTISKPYASNIAHAFGDSGSVLLSADGHWAAFSGTANGLVTNDSNVLIVDSFLRNLDTGVTTLLSRNSAGGSANGDTVVTGISENGQFLLLESSADDLLPDDRNSLADILLYDRQNGTFTSITTNLSAESASSQLTRNGRFVLFESASDELSPIDQNASTDLYLFDQQSREIRLVTLNSNNTASASSTIPFTTIGLLQATLSEDGRYIAFVSSATNLALPRVPPNTSDQLYLRDMIAGTNVWVTRTPSGSAAKDVSSPLLSTNGAVLAFISARFTAPTVPWLHIYSVRSNLLSEVPLPAALQAYSNIDEFAFSADGTHLVYLLSGQVYLYELASGVTTRISSAPDGTAANDVSSSLDISDDGNVVIFASAATNLVPGAKNEWFQLYRHDGRTGTLALLSPSLRNPGGADRDILFPSIDASGAQVAFTSYASDLAVEDDKFVNDVFLVSTSGTNSVQLLSAPLPTSVSATAAGPSEIQANALSDDGRFVVFTSIASDIVPGDDNGSVDVFLHDLLNGQTRLVSSPDGTNTFPSSAAFLSMSRDARFIAFAATNSAEPTTRTVFVFDSTLGTNFAGSVLADGSLTSATEAKLNADGRYLAFRATAGANPGLYVRHLQTQTSHFVTNIINLPPDSFGLSPDGRYLAVYQSSSIGLLIDWQAQISIPVPLNANPPQFSDSDDLLIFPRTDPRTSGVALYSIQGRSTNMIATNAVSATLSADASTVVTWHSTLTNSSLILHDLRSGSHEILAFSTNDPSFRLAGPSALSRDGRFFVFGSRLPLTGGTNYGLANVFLYDHLLGSLTLVSHNPAGSYGRFGSGDPSISKDGRVIVFQSSSDDLLENDRNLTTDVFAARVPLTDTDADQLDDGWEIQHFGNLSATSTADPDADGMSNSQEQLTGTDPNNATSRVAIQTIISESDQITLTATAAPGHSYQLQSKATLATGEWQNVGTPLVTFNTTLSARSPVPTTGTAFYRLLLIR